MKIGKQGLCLDPFGAADVKPGVCCPPGRETAPAAGAVFAANSSLKEKHIEGKATPSGLMAATIG